MRHHPRRAVPGPCLAGHRGRLERGRGAWPGACRSRPPRSVSSGWRRRCRSSCRCAVRTRLRTAASTTRLSAPSTHRSRCGVRTRRSDRRFGGEEDAAAGRPVRAVVQPVRRPGHRAQTRRAPRALRLGRPGLRGDRKDDPVPLRPRAERRTGRRHPRRVEAIRRAGHRARLGLLIAPAKAVEPGWDVSAKSSRTVTVKIGLIAEYVRALLAARKAWQRRYVRSARLSLGP